MKITSDIKWKQLIIAILIPLGVGGISALITGSSMESGTSLINPPFSPPDWIFSVVWPILFILMGFSSYLVYMRDKSDSRRPLAVYAVQLAVNFLWPVFYFMLKAYFFSFIWIIVLWAAVLAMIVLFCRADRKAGLLQIPYLVWLTYAAYLNLGIYLLN